MMVNRQARGIRRASLGLVIVLTAVCLVAMLWALGPVSPVRADPDTRYVDGATGSDDSDCSVQADPCATIAYALTQAANGDEIWVAEGTYNETLDIHGDPLTLRGGYTINGAIWQRQGGETVVDANGADSVVVDISPNNDVTLEGFTIQGANTTSDEGGGLRINAANVIISDTFIQDNTSVGPGAGVWIESSVGAVDVSVSLINCTVISNTSTNGSGGLMAGAGDPIPVKITDTVFTENTGMDVLQLDQPFEIVGGQVNDNTITEGAVDAAIRVGGARSGTISGTEIMSNTSAAILIGGAEKLSGNNLTIRGNTKGGIINVGTLTLTNSLIENNSHSGGWYIISSVDEFGDQERMLLDGCTIRGNKDTGGIVVASGHAEIRDTVIVENDTVSEGGDIVNIYPAGAEQISLVNVLLADNKSARPTVNGNVPTSTITLMNVTAAGNSVENFPILAGDGIWTVTNTIVWGNTAPDDMVGLGTFTVNYSNIEGGWEGTGNLDADPKYVDAAGGDYHLDVGSPCTDKGTPDGAPLADIEGTLRDSAPDMGAYEWTGYRVYMPFVMR